MKNLKLSNIPNENYKSHIEFFLMRWDSLKTLESLWNPETSWEALDFFKKNILKKEEKYSNIIPIDNDNVLFKIIFEAFNNNFSINYQLSLFSKQISPKISSTRIETWNIVAEVANNSYKKVAESDDINSIVA